MVSEKVARFAKEIQQTNIDVTNVVVVGVVAGFDKAKMKLIWKMLVSEIPVPKLERVYGLVRDAKLGVRKEEEVKKFLETEPMKSWINGMLNTWKKKFNWAEYVEKSLKEVK